MIDMIDNYEGIHKYQVRADAELWLETVLAALAKKRFCLVREKTEMSPYKVVITFSIQEIKEQ